MTRATRGGEQDDDLARVLRDRPYVTCFRRFLGKLGTDGSVRQETLRKPATARSQLAAGYLEPSLTGLSQPERGMKGTDGSTLVGEHDLGGCAEGQDAWRSIGRDLKPQTPLPHCGGRPKLDDDLGGRSRIDRPRNAHDSSAAGRERDAFT
jgi:hypothetical protein